jgi:hypothetical protein
MRLSLCFAAMLFAAIAVPSQSIFFDTLDPQDGVNAPVFDVDGTSPLAGPSFLGQLYAALADQPEPPSQLLAVGKPVPFGTGAAADYIQDPNLVMVPNVGRALVWVQLAAWRASDGPTY